jgi:hypothetical protein
VIAEFVDSKAQFLKWHQRASIDATRGMLVTGSAIDEQRWVVSGEHRLDLKGRSLPPIVDRVRVQRVVGHEGLVLMEVCPVSSEACAWRLYR